MKLMRASAQIHFEFRMMFCANASTSAVGPQSTLTNIVECPCFSCIHSPVVTLSSLSRASTGASVQSVAAVYDGLCPPTTFVQSRRRSVMRRSLLRVSFLTLTICLSVFAQQPAGYALFQVVPEAE